MSCIIDSLSTGLPVSPCGPHCSSGISPRLSTPFSLVDDRISAFPRQQNRPSLLLPDDFSLLSQAAFVLSSNIFGRIRTFNPTYCGLRPYCQSHSPRTCRLISGTYPQSLVQDTDLTRLRLPFRHEDRFATDDPLSHGYSLKFTRSLSFYFWL